MELPVGTFLPPHGSSILWLLYPLAPLSIRVLEPEAGVCSRFLTCFLPPYHFIFTQQVLTYQVPAGGLLGAGPWGYFCKTLTIATFL